MSERYASLKQGLVGCWIPSVSGSGFLLPDLSGRGNNGTLTNMASDDWVSSQYGRALDFDGTNDFVNIPRISAYDSTRWRTLSAWINSRTFDGQFGVNDVLNCDFIGQTREWAMSTITDATLTDAKFAISVFGTGGGSIGATTPEIVLANEWTHLCLTQDGSYTFAGFAAYVNGKAQTLTDTSSGTFTSPNVGTNALRLSIRVGPLAQDLHWNGLMDDIRIYNRVLTESEIRLLSSEPGIGFKPAKKLSRFSQRFTYQPPKAKNYGVVRVKETDYATLRQGLVGAWCPSIAGSGNLLPDQSGYGNHGTLTNMAADDWVSSQYGRALDFDNTDDKVDCGSAVNISGAITVSGWMNRKGTPLVSNAVVCAKGGIQGDGNSTFALYFNQSLGWSWFVVDGSNTLAIVRSNTFTSLDVWYPVCGVASANGLQIYINGVLQNTASGGVAKSSAHSVIFGALTDVVGPYGTNAQLNDIRIYNRALSASEIRLLASRPGIGLRQEQHRQTFYQFPSGSRRRRILTGMP